MKSTKNVRDKKTLVMSDDDEEQWYECEEMDCVCSRMYHCVDIEMLQYDYHVTVLHRSLSLCLP